MSNYEKTEGKGALFSGKEAKIIYKGSILYQDSDLYLTIIKREFKDEVKLEMVRSIGPIYDNTEDKKNNPTSNSPDIGGPITIPTPLKGGLFTAEGEQIKEVFDENGKKIDISTDLMTAEKWKFGGWFKTTDEGEHYLSGGIIRPKESQQSAQDSDESSDDGKEHIPF